MNETPEHKCERPRPWWEDKHVLGAIIQPFLYTAIQQAPAGWKPWLEAAQVALMTLGWITARNNNAPLTSGKEQ